MNLVEHLFTVAGEECGEIAQMCSKVNRFGMNEVFPGQPLTNAQRMHVEIDDLMAMIELLNQHADFGYAPSSTRIEAKKAKVMKYAAYSKQLGTLTDQHPTATSDLHKVRDWINDLPIPRPKGTAHMSMVLAQAMKKLGLLE
ncbi:hypothetical protein [Methylobacillus flagellatus]|uniref:Uncharacterized protein n=1 Tax=Methylobacillus flagellatus (strain ATCC 51484 / DSM 6875 / VKM B-1610 / KT) TaxID=265072 RepID=Q1GXP8_METFK|nr:hypothetical protein [Methylobacillus flagellatus]ABE50989.1 hypothetical protein Mfla_2726 [Methylobacillus flagellatus KT]